MKMLSGIGTACLAAVLGMPAVFGQATTPRARNASSEQKAGDTPYLGITAQDITSDRARALKLKEEIGVEVTTVEADSAAAKSGLKVGDVIMDFNGEKVESWEQLVRLVRETPIRREVKLNIWRNGAAQTLTATMGVRRPYRVELGGDLPNTWMAPMPPPALMPPMEIPQIHTLMMMGMSSLGIMGESLGQESQLAEYFGVREGVLVRSVNHDSAAEKAGIKAGDVITKVDDTAISTPQQISGALRGARNKGPVNITVIRNRKEMTLPVTPDANGYYRGGLWNWEPQENVLLDLFAPSLPRKVVQ